MNEYTVKVPGSWALGTVAVDFETVKVPAPPGFRMRNGEALKRRWSIVMAGIGRRGEIVMLDRDGDPEAEFLASVGAGFGFATSVIYAATREFDEMIARGRFTNARRAHEDRPFFPAVPGAESLPWRNVGVLPSYRDADYVRAADVESATLARGWSAEGIGVVLIHLMRDVAELILMAEPDAECRAWCLRVLADSAFAAAALTS
jgi:hypothetical protein